MKISQIKGDHVIEVIADLIGPAASIASDKAAVDLFRKKAVPKGMTAYEFTIKRVKDALPALLRGHKDEVVFILATLAGQTEEEYRAGMTIPGLIKDIVEMLNDEELIQLFT